jgi:hypothetical protein
LISADSDTLMRMVAFEHVRRLGEMYDHLTATELKPGFGASDQHKPKASLLENFPQANGEKTDLSREIALSRRRNS